MRARDAGGPAVRRAVSGDDRGGRRHRGLVVEVACLRGRSPRLDRFTCAGVGWSAPQGAYEDAREAGRRTGRLGPRSARPAGHGCDPRGDPSGRAATCHHAGGRRGGRPAGPSFGDSLRPGHRQYAADSGVGGRAAAGQERPGVRLAGAGRGGAGVARDWNRDLVVDRFRP